MTEAIAPMPKGDDPDLYLISLLSSGRSEEEICARFGLKKAWLKRQIKIAAQELEYKADLGRPAIEAILSPRSHGCPPRKGEAIKYSAPAVTIERVHALDEFNEIVAEVVDAQEWANISLDWVREWRGGWRPADYHTDPELIEIARNCGAYRFIHVWPEGFRADGMVGSAPAVDLEVRKTKGEGKILYGRLASDFYDHENRCRLYSGVMVAIALAPSNRHRWLQFLEQHHMRGLPRVRVTLLHGEQPSFQFELCEPRRKKSV